jgi:UDP-N-acetylglucosamine 2-epimerase
VFRERERPSYLHLFRNMAPEDFLRLLVNSRGIVGNSSVAIRECSFLGVPAVNVGSRQLGRERGANVIDVDYDRRAIATAIRCHLDRPRPASDTLYGDGGAGPRIADAIARASLGVEKRLAY